MPRPLIAQPLLNRRQALKLSAAGLVSLLAYRHAQAAGGFSFGINTDGQPVTALAHPGDRYVAAVFVATDCPVANRYLPLLARMGQQCAAQHVRLWLVYPNPGDTLAAVRSHQQQYPEAAALPQLIAPDPRFIAQAHVHVTPEAALFRAGQVMTAPVLWHGRIDDRYLSFGTQRPAATRHDFADAIRAVLAGQPPVRPPAPPVGCAILPRSFTDHA